LSPARSNATRGCARRCSRAQRRTKRTCALWTAAR